MSGTLFIVATPIGNLEDLSPRARQTLADVDLVAAEDTRHTGRLLSNFGVKRPLLSLHEHNEEQQVTRLIEALQSGKSVALVSDAGTPLVSDPGYRLVRAAHENGVTVSPIPGPSALTAALSVAGLATDRFCFEGFLPAKKKARRDALKALANETRTMVFYESVHRIRDSLDDMIGVFGDDRQAFIGRELTKMYEQCISASLGGLLEQLESKAIAEKGEYVLAVAGTDVVAESSIDIDHLLVELADKLPGKEVAKVLARATGAKRNTLYQRLLELSGRAADGSGES
jgi:16S rRNA (cytidine1402-2'-O)-methyltransferase